MSRLHEGEPEIDEALVRRLVAAQFPQWAGLPVARVRSGGTSNVIYRLGDGLSVRLPRIAAAAEDLLREDAWLPRLAPLLPTAVPEPVALGEPDAAYPWAWAVHRWLDGEVPVPGRLERPEALAGELGAFVRALHGAGTAGGHAAYRSETLASRDAATRAALAAAADLVPDPAALLTVWESALEAPDWAGEPVWIHADLQSGNMLLGPGGRLGAVIDFGCFGLGDPAVDLLSAWYVLPGGARKELRAAAGADEAMWVRGRGWAVSVALMELQYYRRRSPAMVASAQRAVGGLLEGE
ncbi:aminoglycoside phosphotransferase family protein [Kitasatospora sp. NPDC048365]|uniref:aminoglycoside phosphotransferase family protein n=1 Tax=Kitasatospora sp. NPDC048365 TaxID=3364050 RepID=UPI003712E93D